jgi:hypothetical protein
MENFVSLDYAARFGWDVGAGKAEQPAVKCLAERPEERSGRSQALAGSLRGCVLPSRNEHARNRANEMGTGCGCAVERVVVLARNPRAGGDMFAREFNESDGGR